MSALNPPAMTWFMNGWPLDLPTQSFDILEGRYPLRFRMSRMFDSETILCDRSSWVRSVLSARTSSKRWENGPCPTSWRRAAILSSWMSSSLSPALSATDWPIRPATCIVPMTCSNLLCTPPG